MIVSDGKPYRLGWYPAPMLWEYNKNSFDKAGLDADNPPKTWDDFTGALDKLKTAGIMPFGELAIMQSIGSNIPPQVILLA